MTLSDWVLTALTGAFFAWAIYDELGVSLLYGTTRLKIILLRRKPIDNAVFLFLTGILIYKNGESHGSLITTWLLGALILLIIYQGWLHQPKLLFKDRGFFYKGIWIDYPRIKAMNLSQDGVLVIKLDQRRLFIRVRHIDDLDKIYKFLITIQ